jgi:hypothetical protein
MIPARTPRAHKRCLRAVSMRVCTLANIARARFTLALRLRRSGRGVFDTNEQALSKRFRCFR